ncbi:hypothetical protein ACQ4PT_002392 [Festuca glaucescens]
MGVPLGLLLLPLLLLNIAGAQHEAPAANQDLRTGFHLPVGSCPAYVIVHQADVEVTFEVPSMEGMEVLHPALANDAQKLCSLWGADKKGGVGPFGLWVLASAKLEEKTAVFFRVFRVAGRSDTKPVVLMCTDTTRSSLSPNLYRPTFAGFVETDFSQGKITLRSLIDRSVVESFGAGGRTCILSRVNNGKADINNGNAHLHVFNNGKADIKASQLAAWEMKPALMNGA